MTTQAQLLDELDALRAERDLSLIFITHDIALLGDFADALLVMYAGQVCEIGSKSAVLATPRHPYTRALLGAVERTADETGRLAAIPGDPPDPANLLPERPFAPRCPHVMEICRAVNPALTAAGPSHAAACHLLTKCEAAA